MNRAFEWLRTKADQKLNIYVLNPFWHSDDRRAAKKEAVLIRTLDRYFTRYYRDGIPAVPPTEVQYSPVENIWAIWFQGEQQAPPLVQACFRSIRRHCSQELRVLDTPALEEMLDLPPVIWDKFRKRKIKPAHFADICRVELLHNYGGIWLDATCYVTAPIPEMMLAEDFFVYLTGPRTGSPYSYMQNCFIRSRKGAYLLEAWRAFILDFWEKGTLKVDYFQHQLMFKTLVMNDPKAAECFERMPKLVQDPTHRLWFTPDLYRPWDEARFRELTSGAFFQKISFKNVGEYEAGSMIDKILHEDL